MFSSTDEILPPEHLYRVPGAIDAGPEIVTWPSIACTFGVCEDLGGDDVPYDFPITGGRTIAVPAGAHYLVVAPTDGFRFWLDNTGLGFALTLEVL